MLGMRPDARSACQSGVHSGDRGTMAATGMRTIDATTVIEGRRFDGFYYGVIALSWLITAFDGLDGLMIGFTLPYMGDELHLTNAMMGVIASAGNAGTAVGSFLSPL